MSASRDSSRRAAAASPGPPVQERSRRTLDKLLAAAEAALDDVLFEDLSMQDLAGRAGVAVGTVYTRFPDKESLLPALFARHNEAVRGRIERLVTRLEGLPTLDARVAALARFTVDYHLRHRGLLRALTHFVQARPDAIPTDLLAERRAQHAGVARALIGDGRGIVHADPGPVVAAAFATLAAVAKDRVLFADSAVPLPRGAGGTAGLVRHLTHLLHALLTTPSPTR